jgi:S-adenosylmethionine decarboxylase
MTGILLLAESHISVHTWPERGYAALDIYTCGSKAVSRKAMKYIIEKLHPGKYHALTIDRGLEEDGKMVIKKDEVM